MSSPIYLSMPMSAFFGAGTCGRYLLREFAKRGEAFYVPVGEEYLDEETHDFVMARLRPLPAKCNAPMLQFVSGDELKPSVPLHGSPNVGYVFSEWEPLTDRQIENLRSFDVLIAGSEWNAKVIRNAGFECASVPQGVDRGIFKPMPRGRLRDKFVIYSGGKYEHRKAQDLVIRAVKVLQERHDDIVLVASWFNIFDGSDHYDEARASGVKLIGLPLLSHDDLAIRMNQTDVGLFPNRCEGGTNLVMMDYLACGKPVIANVSTGQADVLKDDNYCVLLGGDDELVEQMIERVEYLYQHRSQIERMGRAADVAMNKWSWGRTADGIIKAIEREPVHA